MLGNGDKLKGRAFCQVPYMALEGAKKTIYGNTQGVRKIVFLFLSSPSSLDNDTFTLTCHQWVLGEVLVNFPCTNPISH